MDPLFKHIKVKSLAWIENEGLTFVVKMPDSVKGDDYYRPVGGSVEYGETRLSAVKRELMEELHTRIEVTGEPLILENLFTCEGKFGHEIDYIYPSVFVNSTFYEVKPYKLVEADGCVFEAMWISIEDCLKEKYRLVPEVLLEWYRERQ